MAKIVILEDDEKDLMRRYNDVLRSNHQVAVVLEGIGERYFGSVKYHFMEAGMWPMPNNVNFHFGIENTPTDADVYFSDGLRGKCLEVAEKVGKDRLYVNTSDLSLEQVVKKAGIKVLDRPVKDIVAELK